MCVTYCREEARWKTQRAAHFGFLSVSSVAVVIFRLSILEKSIRSANTVTESIKHYHLLLHAINNIRQLSCLLQRRKERKLIHILL
jgi:hypothetical protein